jgi:ketosteroid isomerase-like protein
MSMLRYGVLVAGLLVLVGGCVFERRPDPDRMQEVERAPDAKASDASPWEDPEAAAASLAEVFREAVRLGDLSLALGLLHRDAVLLDELVGDLPTGAAGPLTRGELLLAVRRIHQDGVSLRPAQVEVTLLDDVALVTSYLDLMRSMEEGGDLAVQEGRVWESMVLVATPEGWRIRHLHRSLRPLD